MKGFEGFMRVCFEVIVMCLIQVNIIGFKVAEGKFCCLLFSALLLLLLYYVGMSLDSFQIQVRPQERDKGSLRYLYKSRKLLRAMLI